MVRRRENWASGGEDVRYTEEMRDGTEDVVGREPRYYVQATTLALTRHRIGQFSDSGNPPHHARHFLHSATLARLGRYNNLYMVELVDSYVTTPTEICTSKTVCLLLLVFMRFLIFADTWDCWISRCSRSLLPNLIGPSALGCRRTKLGKGGGSSRSLSYAYLYEISTSKYTSPPDLAHAKPVDLSVAQDRRDWSHFLRAP